MSVTGLCEVCGSRPAVDRCGNCGTFACESHYERELALCVDCAASARRGRGTGSEVHRFR